MKSLFALFTALLLAPPPALHADEHLIQPGDNPQDVMDRAVPGIALFFSPACICITPANIARCFMWANRSRSS